MNQIPSTVHRATCITLVFLAALALTGAGTGCSSYERAWEAALGEPSLAIHSKPAPTPDSSPNIAPAWMGKWHSEPSDHEGQLRCVVSRTIIISDSADKSENKDEGNNSPRFAFHFHALWGLNFPAEYTIEMIVTESNGEIHFKGEQDLGFLAGGVYRCEGKIVGDQFQATYQSKHDHGTFEMTRVTAATDAPK